MSRANSLEAKFARRVQRREQKRAAALRIPFCGLIVTKAIVKTQRYLRDHGLPHADRVASVLIHRITRPQTQLAA